VESTGLIYYNGSLWSINDSDNQPEFYELSPIDGTVLRTIGVSNAAIVDWEALASDDTYLYIADVGNNLGNRTDLGLYRIPWQSVLQSVGDTSVVADFISYSYSDQTDFSPHYHDNDYDCEAVVVYRDSLHLFSKNWVDNKTRHYRIPAIPGNYLATLLDSFDVQGLITDATIREEEDMIMLLGYTEDYQTFMYLLNDYLPGKPFSGNKRRLDMPNNAFQQVEGITFDDTLSVFFSREYNITGPGLYHLDFTTILHPDGIDDNQNSKVSAIRSKGTISIQLNSENEGMMLVWITDLFGKKLYSQEREFIRGSLTMTDRWRKSQVLILSIQVGLDRLAIPISSQK